MATPKKDPLDVLQLMVNDVLVQTGKALRVSRKDAKGNPVQVQGAVQSKLPDTLRNFHYALDEIESDIVQAKSVLLRDLTQLRTQKSAPAGLPQPIEAQSKSPMVIDLESSPLADGSSAPFKTEPKAMAPFPDMGTGLPDVLQPDVAMKDELNQFQSSTGPEGPSVSAETGTIPAPQDPAPENQTAAIPDDSSGFPDSAPVSNFTNMQFDLAPPANDSQSQPATIQEPSFDLTTMGDTNTSNDMIDIDSFLANPPAQAASNESQEKSEQNKPAERSSSLDAFFNADGTPADGMDFDFGLEGGMGEDTFDDLIQDRDDNYGTMEHGEFDATYFGLDQSDT